MTFKWSLCLIASYLIGCVNPAYLIARWKGFDIRSQGSGNAGASNAVITMGRGVGAFSAAFDIFKVCLCCAAAEHFLAPSKTAFAATAFCCSVGHIFPVFMKFRGGKGLACLIGTIAMYNWKFLLILLVCELIFGLLTDYLCLVSISAPLVFTVFYAVTAKDFAGTLLFTALTGIILFRHLGNLRRISQKTEMRLSYLWNPKKEKARMQELLSQNEKKDSSC